MAFIPGIQSLFKILQCNLSDQHEEEENQMIISIDSIKITVNLYLFLIKLSAY